MFALQSERILLPFRPAFACETELPTWYCCRAGCRPFVHLYLATKMLSAAGDSSLLAGHGSAGREAGYVMRIFGQIRDPK